MSRSALERRLEALEGGHGVAGASGACGGSGDYEGAP
jgi:hypothetical protein